MCGICGFNWKNEELVHKMMKMIKHRGPDDEGTYLNENISLGHTRLSIIDLKTGKQPIYNEDKSIVVIFNGEIYNYEELKKDLKNHIFYTNTDTEVLVHMWEEHKEKMFEKLNGCFSFAIYDSNENKIILARDRFGIKPLYYYYKEKKLIFASEIKAILEHEDIKREVNFETLKHYLMFRCAPLSKTMFKDIFKILPGEYAIIDNDKLKKEKYYNLPETNVERNGDHKDLYLNISESVDKRHMSDVPLGIFLSGGIDSGTITALSSQKQNGNVKTFSVGFEEDSELLNARRTAKMFNTDHTEILVKENQLDLLPEIVWHHDEPMADPTSIPTFILAKEAKKKVSVVLTGEGADEIFGGYKQYSIMDSVMYNTIPSFFVNIIPKKVLNMIFKYASRLGKKGIERMKKFQNAKNPNTQYIELVSIFDEEELEELGIQADIFFDDIKKKNKSEYLKFDIKHTLTDNLLMKVDKNTMAHGLEARVPFLDHNIVDWTFRNIRDSKKEDKIFMREALLKNGIEEDIVTRKKQRFFVPIDKWGFKERSYKFLNKENTKDFNWGYIEKIFKDYDKSPLFYARQLYSIVNYVLWKKIFIEGIDYRIVGW